MEKYQIHILQKMMDMIVKTTALCVALILFACDNNANSKNKKLQQKPIVATQKVHDATQIKNIPLPDGYTRIENGDDSFSSYLQNVGLKADKTVYKFDGTPKGNQTAQYAVLNISVGNRDLQQCADAVMRLRAEYLFTQKRYDEIIFTDNENIDYKFTAPYDRDNFLKYMNRVFGMCGSASLAKQLKPKTNFLNIAAGDVIIKGGFPGHAVIVMDVAQNAEGKRIYLLAQSYMPAQDIHVIVNPANENLSPWYEVNENDILQTPEYTFYKNQLMQW